MPKIRTNRSAKKRFSLTATGKVKAAPSGKRHGMVKRTKKQVRNLRGESVLAKCDFHNIKKYLIIS